jgi:hypothetical protein
LSSNEGEANLCALGSGLKLQNLTGNGFALSPELVETLQSLGSFVAMGNVRQPVVGWPGDTPKKS